MLKSLNGTRLGGLMLIVGIAVVFLSGIFSPAVLIIDMVTGIEPANVEERLVAKVTNPDATNLTATFYLLGHVVLLGGLFALWPPRGRRESRGDVDLNLPTDEDGDPGDHGLHHLRRTPNSSASRRARSDSRPASLERFPAEPGAPGSVELVGGQRLGDVRPDQLHEVSGAPLPDAGRTDPVER